MAATTKVLIMHRVSPGIASTRIFFAKRQAWSRLTIANNNNPQNRFCLVAARSVSSSSTTADEKLTLSQSAIPTTELMEKPSPSSNVKAYADLAKARLSALVVSTTACGFLAAGGPLISPPLMTATVVGTALCSSSAAALNQIFEVDRDKRMKRTQQRPLVLGTLTSTQATAAATIWGVGGVGLLYVGTDPTTALLGASNIALYAGLYTWMKPRSIYNTWIGAVVGAIPPVMGFSAATGGAIFDIEAIILGSTLYLWQMPHFFALSYMHRHDYARGGFAMVPVLEGENGEQTAQLITRYAAYLSTIPFIATFSGVTSSMFALEGIALNAYALHVAHKFSRERTNANARKVFLTSLWYLPSFMMLYLLHNKVWDEEENKVKKDDAIREWMTERIHSIREVGKELCIHEKAIVHNTTNKDMDEEANRQACPVTLGQQKAQALKRRATETASVVVATATNTDSVTPNASS